MLKKIKENIGGIFKNKKNVLMIVFVLLLLGLAGYIFKSHVYPKLNPTYVSNKEFTNKDDSVESNKPPEIANINYYYTQWCPYCKKASGEWEATKSKFDGKVINNHKIQFNEIDCDAKENAEQVKDIDGYPTIKIFLPDGKTVEYDSKPDRKTLELFINSVLNE